MADLTRPEVSRLRQGVSASYEFADDLAARLNVAQEAGTVVVFEIEFADQATTTDTIGVGDDTYEFVTAAGAVAADANIAVEIGAAASDTRDNLIAAVNAVDANNLHANITNVATTAPALANGTENYVADENGTAVRFKSADRPGGSVVAAAPAGLLTEALTPAASVWSVGDVNVNTLGGRAQASLRSSTGQVTVTAAMITAGFYELAFPFTPTRFVAQVDDGSGSLRSTDSADVYAIAGDSVLVTLGGGVDPAIQAGDTLTVHASE